MDKYDAQVFSIRWNKRDSGRKKIILNTEQTLVKIEIPNPHIICIRTLHFRLPSNYDQAANAENK